MDFTIRKLIFYSLTVYAFAAPLSIAGQSIFTTLAVILALIDIFKHKRIPTIEKIGDFKAIGLFFLVLLMSSVFSMQAGHSFNVLWSFLARFILFFVVLLYVRESKQIAVIVTAYALGWIVSDIYTLYQWKLGIWRASGFFSNAMMLGDSITIALPLLASQIASDYSRKIRIIIVGSGMLTACALLANGTRSAWLAMFVPIVVLVVLGNRVLPKKLLASATVTVLVLVGVIFIFDPFRERILSVIDMTNPNNYNRVWLWQSAIQLWRDHPILGVGLGNFENYFNMYIAPKSEFFGSKANAHSTFFQMLAENGTVGVISYVYLFFSLIRTHYNNCCSSTSSLVTAWGLGGVMFTLAIFVQGFAEYNIGSSPVARQFWFVTGLAFAAYRVQLSQPREVEENKL